MRVKIIASIGPSSKSPEVLREFYRIGVRCFRINMAHGDQAFWSDIVKAIRDLEKVMGDRLCLIGDLPGPSIRLGEFKEFSFKKGSKVVFSNSGDGVPLRDKEFFEIAEEGDIIMLDDGRVMLEVIASNWDRVEAIAITDGVLKPGKGLTIKGKEPASQIIRDRDFEAIRFSVENKFTYLGISHVRNAEDLRIVRETINKLGGRQRLLAKIENASAVKNIEQIVRSSDGVVIARGDLGMNLGLEEVPIVQRKILEICHRLGKPAIVATQILESMTSSPVPTRAEVNDLYVAVTQGADAIMLTGETAVGLYPVEAVRWARKVIERAEREPGVTRDSLFSVMERGVDSERDRYSYGIYRLSESLEAPLVILDREIDMALAISVYKPSHKIYLLTDEDDIYRQSHILWGVEPVYIHSDNGIEAREAVTKHIKETLRKSGIERTVYSRVIYVNNIEKKRKIEIFESLE
ncbi:pyruvate kinase [Desulfurococcaceae archaeon AG1]|nr:pyruvate kinase [Desulfurococcaceae archaeon AG1]